MACPNLEEAHLLSVAATPPLEASPPIPSSQLLRLRALTLRQADTRRQINHIAYYLHPVYPRDLDGAAVALLLLAAPQLERVYLDRIEFDACAVEALGAALDTGSALQRMRFVCVGNAQWHKGRRTFDELLKRMRDSCPHFGRCLVSSNDEHLDMFWRKFFTGDSMTHELPSANILPILTL